MITAKVIKESNEYVTHDLEYGKTYEVKYISMGQSFTTIYLVDKLGCYNSENDKPLDIYSDARFNPYIRKSRQLL